MIPTVPVTVTASDQSGNPVAGARVIATLDQTEIYQGFVAPEKVEAFADANGVAVLNLWPNALGVAGSRYRVRVINPDNGCMFLDVLAAVPNSACNLHEIIVQEPYPPIDAAQQALIAAQGALALGTEQAGIATDAAEATAADRIQTGQDAQATAADRTQTGLDRQATAADRIATGQDRVQTGQDAVAASQSAADAAASAAQVIDAVPLGGTTGQVLAKASNADLDTVWVNQTGGGGATNLSTTATPNTVTINSDTGSDATIAAADATNAGLILPAEKTKLAGIAAGATANSADATLLARANHTGTQLASTISDFSAAVATTPAVAANTAKVSNATHTGDVTGDTALTIANNAVTNAKAADVPTATIKGRVTAGTGDPEDLTATQAKALLAITAGDVSGLGTAATTDATAYATAVHTHVSTDVTDFAAASRAQTEAELVAGANITITPSGTGATRQLTIAASGGGTPGGTNTQVQFNDGGVFAGAAGWTWNKTTNTMTLASGTQTADNPAQTITQTWNNAGATFTGLRLNVTDTASNANSLLANFELGGLSRFSVDKNGAVVANRSISFVENIAFTTPPATGIGNYFGALGIFSGSTRIAIASNTGLRIDNGGLHFSNAEDVSIFKDAANTLAQRRGANPQTSRIYGSFTDAGNYERGSIAAGASGLVIGHEAAGTGTARPLLFQTGGATRLMLGIDGVLTLANSWSVTPGSFSLDFNFGGTSRVSVGWGFELTTLTLNNTPNATLNLGWSLTTNPVINFGSNLALTKDAANTLAQRNGTNAQTSRIYGTFADAGNHRRLSLGMSTAGVAEIKPEGAGTGASGNVLHISGLPTANPGPGILWNDAGTVKVGT